MAEPVAVTTFDANLGAVRELMRLDKLALELALDQLRRVQERQIAAKITNQRLRVDSAIQLLSNIHRNGSLRPHYAAMYNQCLVLLVAHFGSALKDLFISAVAAAVESGSSRELLGEELRVTVADLRDLAIPLSAFVGEQISERKDVSFQDMQSTDRTFRKYFGTAPNRSTIANDIILAQACRHAIVHADARVNERTMSQVRDANPRTLKTSLKLGSRVQFEPDELDAVGNGMRKYLSDLAGRIPIMW